MSNLRPPRYGRPIVVTLHDRLRRNSAHLRVVTTSCTDLLVEDLDVDIANFILITTARSGYAARRSKPPRRYSGHGLLQLLLELGSSHLHVVWLFLTNATTSTHNSQTACYFETPLVSSRLETPLFSTWLETPLVSTWLAQGLLVKLVLLRLNLPSCQTSDRSFLALAKALTACHLSSSRESGQLSSN